MDSLTVLNVALAIVNLAVALFQAWKEWGARRRHPLDSALREIASAIRDMGDL